MQHSTKMRRGTSTPMPLRRPASAFSRAAESQLWTTRTAPATVQRTRTEEAPMETTTATALDEQARAYLLQLLDVDAGEHAADDVVARAYELAKWDWQ